MRQLSPCHKYWDHAHSSDCALQLREACTPKLEKPLNAATRESPCIAMKTQHSQKDFATMLSVMLSKPARSSLVIWVRMMQEGFRPFRKVLTKKSPTFSVCQAWLKRWRQNGKSKYHLILALWNCSLVEATDTNHMIIQINVKLKFLKYSKGKIYDTIRAYNQ